MSITLELIIGKLFKFRLEFLSMEIIYQSEKNTSRQSLMLVY